MSGVAQPTALEAHAEIRLCPSGVKEMFWSTRRAGQTGAAAVAAVLDADGAGVGAGAGAGVATTSATGAEVWGAQPSEAASAAGSPIHTVSFILASIRRPA